MKLRSIVFLLVALVALVAASGAAAATNLVSNPSCATNTTGWTTDNATLSSHAVSGDFVSTACESAYGGSGTYYTLRASSASVPSTTAGTTYYEQIQIQAASTSAAGKPMLVRINEFNSSNVQVATAQTSFTLSSAWQLQAVKLTAVGSGDHMNIRVEQDSPTAGDAFYANAITATTSNPDPSGATVPIGDLTGWHEIAADDFTIDAPLGSWAATTNNTVVYTGDRGTPWYVYPDGWSCPAGANQYPSCNEPGQVLSVSGGELDYYLHVCNTGLMCGANPSPVLPGNTQYQTYGRYTTRFKVTYGDVNDLSEEHVSFLLWPQNNSDGPCAESDWPEQDFNATTVYAFSHYETLTPCSSLSTDKKQQSFGATIDVTQWHTYTQEWGVGYRKYYLDGTLIGTATNDIWSGPERWQLQIGAHDAGIAESGHLLVDWVAIYAPA